MGDLVEALHAAIGAMMAGDLSARARFAGDTAAIDDELLSVVDEFNAMAERFEQLTGLVDANAERLGNAVERARSAAADIDEHVEEQAQLLANGSGELQNLSATMEEIAATADQVREASEQARERTSDGLAASNDTRTTANAVVEMSESLVSNVVELGERMDDIEAVTEVISAVADQTNPLALNANIEAASDYADRTEDATTTIVDAVEEQSVAIDDLPESVAALHSAPAHAHHRHSDAPTHDH